MSKKNQLVASLCLNRQLRTGEPAHMCYAILEPWGVRWGGGGSDVTRGPDDERENSTALVGLYFNPTVLARLEFFSI